MSEAKRNSLVLVENDPTLPEFFWKIAGTLGVPREEVALLSSQEEIGKLINAEKDFPKPNLILLDLDFEGENETGYTLLKKIKDQDHPYSTIPVLAFTSDPDMDKLKKVHAEGANIVLQKPLDLHTLRSVMAAFLGVSY